MASHPLDASDFKQQLSEARAAYKRATAEYKRLMALSAATEHPQDPAFVDGAHALRQAMSHHRHARLRYEAALRRFNVVALNSQPPARNEGTPVQEDLLSLALRVLACFTDEPRRVPSEGDVLRLLDTASVDEAGMPVDELAVAIIDRERKRHIAQR